MGAILKRQPRDVVLNLCQYGMGKVWEWGRDVGGLFNRGEGTVEVAATWADVGVSGKQTVRDLWRQQDVGVFEGRYAKPVGRHGVVLVKVSKNR